VPVIGFTSASSGRQWSRGTSPLPLAECRSCAQAASRSTAGAAGNT